MHLKVGMAQFDPFIDYGNRYVRISSGYLPPSWGAHPLQSPLVGIEWVVRHELADWWGTTAIYGRGRRQVRNVLEPHGRPLRLR
jgi:hypothetical protein